MFWLNSQYAIQISFGKSVCVQKKAKLTKRSATASRTGC